LKGIPLLRDGMTKRNYESHRMNKILSSISSKLSSSRMYESESS
jgi:hypothetical protein